MDVRDVLPPDAIPSVDEPSFGTEYFGDADDLVIVVEASPPRAYPIRILHYHEIVNDELQTGTGESETGTEPVAVTWCPLCGSAIVYDRRVEGRTLTFGVSGKLADDDLVMYDRETGSEWKQSLGECFAGKLAGTRLSVRPASMVTWRTFRDEHPEGVVLQPLAVDSEVASDDDEPAPVDYEQEPYERYFESDGFGLAAHRVGESDRRWNREDLDPKAVVLGVECQGTALGFPLPLVRECGGVVQTTVGSTDVVVFEVDGELHAYEAPGFEFQRGDGGFAGDGTRWDGATGRAADGRRLDRLPARRLFAFTWQDDHGPDAFYESSTAAG